MSQKHFFFFQKGLLSRGHLFIALFASYLSIVHTYADTAIIHLENLPEQHFKKTEKEKLLNGQVLSFAYVKTQENNANKRLPTSTAPVEKIQKIDFSMAALHPKTCTSALRILSRYEEYSERLDFVKESKYEEGRVKFLLSPSLIPLTLTLDFILPKIKSPGVYAFAFDRGNLKGLIGEIHVSEHVIHQSKNKQCFFYLKAHRHESPSKYPDTLLEMFGKTLMQLGMERLIRLSSL